MTGRCVIDVVSAAHRQHVAGQHVFSLRAGAALCVARWLWLVGGAFFVGCLLHAFSFLFLSAAEMATDGNAAFHLLRGTHP